MLQKKITRDIPKVQDPPNKFNIIFLGFNNIIKGCLPMINKMFNVCKVCIQAKWRITPGFTVYPVTVA